MRLLLDSHVSLWWLDEDGPVSPEVRELVDDLDNQVLVSAASVWELAIKRAKGHLRMPDDYVVQLEHREVDILDITASHAIIAAALPPVHRDPFDRMIVAQAQSEDLVLVTADRRIPAYGVATLSPR